MSIGDRTRATGWATAKGDGRRKAILEALRDLLRDEPLASISIRMITERAGVTRSAYYFYFPSKSAAVMALLEDLREHVFILAQAWLDGGPGTPEQRLRAGMTAAVDSWRRNPAWTAAILDAVNSDPEGAAIWQGYVDGYVSGVAQRIELEAPNRAPLTAEALATGLVAMLFGIMERDIRAIQATGAPLPEVVDALVYVWLTSIYGADAA